MGTQKIKISDDQEKDFQEHRSKTSDGFVVNIEETTPTNSRITRSLTRKASQIDQEKEGDDLLVTNESLKEIAVALIGSCTNEKSDFIVNVVEQHSSSSPQQQQQQQNNMNKSITHQESSKFMRKMRRRSSYNNNNHYSSSIRAWIDPRRILFFFATLSSMGTIILIYFTLSMAKLSSDGSNAHA